MNNNFESLVDSLVNSLKTISGVKAIVMGGSRADDTHRPDSDYDIGIYYNSSRTLDIDAIRELSCTINDTPQPTVTSIGGWGKWVNGGAWLTINSKRVDLIYRDLNFVTQIIQDCKKGLRQSDYYQQPPYGFHSYIYCSEIKTCRVLFDPDNLIAGLKAEVKEYPVQLKRTIVEDFLWDAEFSLWHCKKSARRAEVLIVSGCLTKIASDLVQVLYALNEVFFMSEKKFYKQEQTLKIKPAHFWERINRILGETGQSAEELNETVNEAERLFKNFVSLAGDLYMPKFKY